MRVIVTMARLGKRNRLLKGAVFLAGVFVLSMWKFRDGHNKHLTGDNAGSIDGDLSGVHTGRQLLTNKLDNCSPPAIEQFPVDLFGMRQRLHGAILFHIVVCLYMFQGLALICDDYFVPALERICEVLKLKPDVAGATFMAAGSSAPELAAAVIGVFIAKNDIGLGTVVGSAVFNIMFVIAVCALFAGMVTYLNWWPLFRDCSYYTISVLALVLVIYDEKVYWYEALCLLILYLLYIVMMYFNPQLEHWMTSRFSCCDKCQDKSDNNKKPLMQYELVNGGGGLCDSSDEETVYKSKGEPVNRTSYTVDSSMEMGVENYQLTEAKAHTHIDNEPDSVFNVPQGKFKLVLWILSLPLIVLMFVSVPDCRKSRWKKLFLVTFFMSLVWISAYSYVLVWMIAVIGHTFHIPDTIMGLTFMAAGVSIPDAIASLIVAKDGFGDMAVSNAVGSNVFDILLCLGLPWFLDAVYHKEVIEVYSEGLVYSAITLLSTVVFLLIATHLNGWKLDKKFGAILMVGYVLFMVLASLYELNIFGKVHPPECLTTYD